MRSLKILVIDDQESTRWLMEQALKEQNHQVVTASKGEEGLEIIKKSPNFDLIISDRKMRMGMRGEEVIRKVKLLTPSAKTILMSAFNNEEEAVRATKVAGADSFFDKSTHLDLRDIKDSITNLFPALLPR